MKSNVTNINSETPSFLAILYNPLCMNSSDVKHPGSATDYVYIVLHR